MLRMEEAETKIEFFHFYFMRKYFYVRSSNLNVCTHTQTRTDLDTHTQIL